MPNALGPPSVALSSAQLWDFASTVAAFVCVCCVWVGRVIYDYIAVVSGKRISGLLLSFLSVLGVELLWVFHSAVVSRLGVRNGRSA